MEYRQQLNDMGEMPDFRNMIAEAYQNPVIKPITQEASDLYSAYLPTIFSAFTGAAAGTGAGDMSAAAKLANIGNILGRHSGKIAANKDVQSFYNTQINDLANAEVAKWQQRQQQIKDLWNMAFQAEEADRQEREAAAARANAARMASGGIDWNNILGQISKSSSIGSTPVRSDTEELIKQRNSLIQKIQSIPKVNYKRPDGTIGSRAMSTQVEPYLQSLYRNLQNLGYGDVTGIAGGNPF